MVLLHSDYSRVLSCYGQVRRRGCDCLENVHTVCSVSRYLARALKLKLEMLLLPLLAILLATGILTVARCSPGISVTSIPIDPFVTAPGDHATYTISVESMTTEDENVRLTIYGAPNLEFDWTTKDFVLIAGDTESIALDATYSGTTPGDFAFTVSGEAWPRDWSYEEAAAMGLLETSDFTDYVHVTPQGIIPEVPLGTIMASASIVAAFVAYITVPRIRKRQLPSI